MVKKNILSRIRISLGLRLIVLIVFIFVFFVSIFMAVNVFIFWKKASEDFQHNITYIADFTANSNSTNVWNLDYENLKKYMDSMLVEKTLVAVIFETGETTKNHEQHYYGLIAGELIDRKEPANHPVVPPPMTFSHQLERPILYQNTKIGMVHLYFSDKFILAEVLRQARLFIINIIAFIILFSLSIYLSLKQQLLNPLKKIHSLAMRVSGFTNLLNANVSQERWRNVEQLLASEKQNQKDIQEKIRNDELGDFMQAFLKVLNGFEVIVSELSQYSEQLQTMNDDLEKRITNRTAELETSNEKISESLSVLQKTQSQLIQQEKLASIGQLAAGVAQEINTPMGYLDSNISRLDNYLSDFRQILISIEKSLSGLPDEISKRALAELTPIKKRLDFDFMSEDFPIVISDCRDGIAKIKEIVQSLKDFSHNMDEKTFAEIDINNAINTTLKVLNNEIKYYCDLELDLKLETKVHANLGQIHQVLSNLIINASQAMRETGKRGLLSIRTFTESNFAIIEIEDTGVGIPEEIYTKIFDPFFTTKPLGQGAGLGLNISYDIVVNKHKGDLSFVSKIGIGSLFTIKLPLQIPAIKTAKSIKGKINNA